MFEKMNTSEITIEIRNDNLEPLKNISDMKNLKNL